MVAVSTLYRLKAYFGMVPVEDMDAYLGYDEPDYADQHGAHHTDQPDHRGDQGWDRPGYPRPRTERPEPADRSGYHADHVESRSRDRGWDGRSSSPGTSRVASDLPAPVSPADGLGASGFSGRTPPTRGALAVEPLAEDPTRSGPALLAAEHPSASGASRELPLSRITTVHPRSYNEARTIGERYREGIPVIMNLTELDDAAAKRLVDFAAGLAFALRGSIDKVTNRVFLLSPAGVDVSAEDRRKLAERGFSGQG